MKYILLIISLLMLNACGGGSSSSDDETNLNDPISGTEGFIFHNVRFDGKDYYDEEQVTVTEGARFEVQWVSPTSASYKIDLYLSANGAAYSDNNKIVDLKCGSDSFSLCPNAVAEVQCEINDNTLSCFSGSDFLGSKPFKDADLASLKLIIKGCDGFNYCDVKTFSLLIAENTEG
ncbi:hypothetical protein GCM10009111_05580 [Colwellia asteriadis]|uniref:Lipoprotein n=1 Tax=Colwellia asteriadis TaxID=517723 RepID=A0ABN1L3H2_9GAMM